MPKVKQTARNKTDMTRTRLRILDNLLGGGGEIPDRKELTRRVNRHLTVHVSPSTIDKDLGKIRHLLEDEETGVELVRNGGGYRYSEEGFTLFHDQVTEKELKAFRLIAEAYAQSLGAEGNRVLQDLARKLYKICPCAIDEPHRQGGSSKNLECTASGKKEWPFLMQAWSYTDSRRTARLRLLDGGEGQWQHVSPCRILKEKDEFWLVGIDLTGGKAGPFVAFRISEIGAFEPSNKSFVDGEHLDEPAFRKEWTKKLGRMRSENARVVLGSPDEVEVGKRRKAKDRRTAADKEEGLTVASLSEMTTLPGAEGRMLGMIQHLAI